MGWAIRDRTNHDVPVGRMCPDYGGINDCNDLMTLETDLDVLNLVKFIDENRMVEIFVEHEKYINLVALDKRNTMKPIHQTHQTQSNITENLPDIDEPLNFLGDFEDSGDDNVGSEAEHVGMDDNVGSEDDNGGMDDNVGSGDDNSVRVQRDIELSESDADQSVGSDSELGEEFVDSGNEVSDEDDLLFDSNIDNDVEWGGLHMNDVKGNKISSSQVPKAGQKRVGKNPVRHNLDHPKLALGMDFTDTASIKNVVRQHAITQGRDVSFTINHRFKVQAKCKHKTCPWVIYASKVQNEDTIQVKTYVGTHKCPRSLKVSHATPSFLANMYKDRIMTDPRWPIDSMMTNHAKDIKLVFNKWRCV
ncbi:hypothetical protein DH2020_029250 [Rehmannia glutinosa]|uniref:Transposase MuDR plant domain-containing protein n=1 Tax=Rehmannia glutinosa TaxID=99300 RepID=A0ABR0VSQ6_REHGL